jgi:hypothetical protein
VAHAYRERQHGLVGRVRYNGRKVVHAILFAPRVWLLLFVLCITACATNHSQLQTFNIQSAGHTTGDTTEDITRGGNVPQADTFRCVDSFTGPKITKEFTWGGQCSGNNRSGCAYYRYDTVPLADRSRFDQRGVEDYQVSFPLPKHLHGALRLTGQNNIDICYAGGAVIGRNPLAMVWGGEGGGKNRKNNFLSIGGSVKSSVIEGVRVHNNHDPFYGTDTELRDSWITWNRDDLFESKLEIAIRDTLVDGTYTFLSAPDSCHGGNLADNTVVIENSLIRLQKMPGGYSPKDAPFNPRDWTISGRYNALWKPDRQCGGWDGYPKFELRNNVFLVEGRPIPNGGLPIEPGADSEMAKLVACDNNLFLYYSGEQGEASKPVLGEKYYNPENPTYAPNGKDCFQRITNKAEAMRIWNERRAHWIARHTGSSDPKENVMMISGVDYPVFSQNQHLQIRNKATNQCIERGANLVDVILAPCNGSDAQLWNSQAFSDGKLMGAILLRNKGAGGYLRTQDQKAIENDGNDNDFDPDVYWTNLSTPNFSERWYIYPLGDEPGGELGTYSIESDALRRSYMFANGNKLQVQLFYKDGTSTALPQSHFASGDDARLQWYIEPR